MLDDLTEAVRTMSWLRIDLARLIVFDQLGSVNFATDAVSAPNLLQHPSFLILKFCPLKLVYFLEISLLSSLYLYQPLFISCL